MKKFTLILIGYLATAFSVIAKTPLKIIKNQNMKSLIFLSIYILLALKCHKMGGAKYALDIKNNSTYAIAFYVAALGIEHMYPDTTLQTFKPSMQVILPGASAPWYISVSFDELFKLLPRDTLSLYLFHQDTLNKYDWSAIRNGYKVLKRYDLSLSDLKNRNFIINYP